MINLVCPYSSIGDPQPVAIALPDLAADAARQNQLRRKRVFNPRAKKFPGDVESLFSYPLRSNLDHPSPL
jgi:hypothetical protein